MVIQNYRYDSERKELVVIFQSGGAYTYKQVPLSIFEWLKGAFSKGEYFSSQIRGRFGFRRHNSSPCKIAG